MEKVKNSVLKTFRLLECFTAARPEWGVTELAAELDANKSTVYRFLSQLKRLGVVYQNANSNKYSLGLKLFELGNRVQVKSSFAEIARPELMRVGINIRETVHLAVLRDSKIFYIDKVESPHGLSMRSEIGSYNPAHATSLGKVLLAYSIKNDLALREYFSGKRTLEKYTLNTIRSIPTLFRELKKVRAVGYALDREEFELGLVCVAVPIFNQKDELVAGLSASGPASRFEEEKLVNYVKILQEGASRIREKIGLFKI